jgi:hypothetical protein
MHVNIDREWARSFSWSAASLLSFGVRLSRSKEDARPKGSAPWCHTIKAVLPRAHRDAHPFLSALDVEIDIKPGVATRWRPLTASHPPSSG